MVQSGPSLRSKDLADKRPGFDVSKSLKLLYDGVAVFCMQEFWLLHVQYERRPRYRPSWDIRELENLSDSKLDIPTLIKNTYSGFVIPPKFCGL